MVWDILIDASVMIVLTDKANRYHGIELPFNGKEFDKFKYLSPEIIS